MAPESVAGRKRGPILMALMWLGALGASWVVYRFQQGDNNVHGTPTEQSAITESATVATPTDPTATTLATTATHYRIDPHHTGRSPHIGPERGDVRWKRDLEGRVTAQPVIGHGGNVYVGTHAGVMWAINGEGIVRWKRSLGARIFGAALVGPDEQLFVGTDGHGLFSLDAKGNTRFVIDTHDADADTAPTLAPNGEIRFAAGDLLYAIDNAGHVLWTFDAGDKIFSSPTVDDNGTTYFGCENDNVYAIDTAGKEAFRFKTKGDVDVSPVVDEQGALYFGSDDQHVYALTSAGALRWSTKLDGYVRGALALGADGSVLATHEGARSALVALDRDTGEQRFRFAFALSDRADTGVRGGALTDSSGNIFVGSDDDYLYALTPEGKLRWAAALGSDVEAGTTLTADGTLYAVSSKGILYAIGGNLNAPTPQP